MPTRRCCCTLSCELGFDDFNRPDSPDPGPKWHIVEGEWEIFDNTVMNSNDEAGVLATRICHPEAYELGSWISEFTLVDLLTRDRFAIRAGNPIGSTYEVEFLPNLYDGTITVNVQGEESESFTFQWPFGTTTYVNELRVKVCYLPDGIFSASVGEPPTVDACIDREGAEPCYQDYDGTPIGNFSFLEGRFDDWDYEATILDDWNCPDCGCFCFKRQGNNKEHACFPDEMTLSITLVDGDCDELDGLTFTMKKGQLQPDDGYPQKQRWYSDVFTCNGFDTTFVLECSTVQKAGTEWFRAMSLRVADGVYLPSTIVFIWDGVTGTTQQADYDASTCEPLAMVFPDLLAQSVFGPCGAPGEFGYFPLCCSLPYGLQCYESPPTIRFNVTLTE